MDAGNEFQAVNPDGMVRWTGGKMIEVPQAAVRYAAMPDDKVLEIIKFAQGLDLHGRNDQLASHLKAGKVEDALNVCDAAILDSEEMTRPDRTIFRRNVHEKNQRKLKQLRGMVAELNS